YGILRLINFAHGDIFMVGAFIGLAGAVWLKLPIVPTLLFTMACTALLGVTIERLAYKPLRNAPRVSAVITALGVGIFLEHFVLGTVGAQSRAFPALIAAQRFDLPGGLTMSSVQLLIIGVSVLLMMALDWFIRGKTTGMAMRAISWDRLVVPLLATSVEGILYYPLGIASLLRVACSNVFCCQSRI